MLGPWHGMVPGEERAVGGRQAVVEGGCQAEGRGQGGAWRETRARTGGPGREQARKLVQALAPTPLIPLNMTLSLDPAHYNINTPALFIAVQSRSLFQKTPSPSPALVLSRNRPLSEHLRLLCPPPTPEHVLSTPLIHDLVGRLLYLDAKVAVFAHDTVPRLLAAFVQIPINSTFSIRRPRFGRPRPTPKFDSQHTSSNTRVRSCLRLEAILSDAPLHTKPHTPASDQLQIRLRPRSRLLVPSAAFPVSSMPRPGPPTRLPSALLHTRTPARDCPRSTHPVKPIQLFIRSGISFGFPPVSDYVVCRRLVSTPRLLQQTP